MLMRYFLKEYAWVGVMHVGHYEGSLQNGFILKDISITGLSYLPNAVLRIQEIDTHLSFADWGHFDSTIFNARLVIPGSSDPIVFTGELSGEQVKGEFYTRSVDIHDISQFWISEDVRKHLKGNISNVDFTVQGPIYSPRMIGTFTADGIQYKTIGLTSGISKADLMLTPSLAQVQLKGEVELNFGIVKVRNVDLQLSTGKIIFQGDVMNPKIYIFLGAKVEDMDIHLVLKGTLSEPQLMVSADPPMSAQDALQVLFTGNALSQYTSPFNGMTSNELAVNFIDYSLEQTKTDQPFGLKTKLTNNLKIGAEMDQVPTPPGNAAVYYSPKINGEMDLSQHMSLNISQEVLSQGRDPSQYSQDGQSGDETQIYVQYKKRF